ncbi:MAG: alpha/beta hydrolase [Oscillospiraceae bacterium]
MAFISAEIKIPQAALSVNTQLYFPTDLPEAVGNKVKGVITLLHGMGNSGRDWMRMTAACRYAADNGYILVAPDAGNSFYTNMRHGPPYYTVMTEWLPQQLQAIFHIPTAREINYIAGLSMGGFGAMLLGLSNPQRYAAIGSFSGALSLDVLVRALSGTAEYDAMTEAVIGSSRELPPELDIKRLLKEVAQLPAAQQPRIFCSCGLQDEEPGRVHWQNDAFYQVAKTLPLADYTYREWDGVHEWNFWDRSLAEFIGFVQNSDYGQRKRGDWKAQQQVSTNGHA